MLCSFRSPMCQCSAFARALIRPAREQTSSLEPPSGVHQGLGYENDSSFPWLHSLFLTRTHLSTLGLTIGPAGKSVGPAHPSLEACLFSFLVLLLLSILSNHLWHSKSDRLKCIHCLQFGPKRAVFILGGADFIKPLRTLQEI